MCLVTLKRSLNHQTVMVLGTQVLVKVRLYIKFPVSRRNGFHHLLRDLQSVYLNKFIYTEILCIYKYP